jgi:hypothetical protein
MRPGVEVLVHVEDALQSKRISSWQFVQLDPENHSSLKEVLRDED